MKARGRQRNIQKEPPREIISTTGESFYVSRIQHGRIGHATGKVEYDMDGTFLYSLSLLTLILSERIVPDWNTVC